MGKFGCRLCCWGCGGCCIITGVVMGILAGMLPSGLMTQIQEGAFDLAYIDDTSQTEEDGLFAEVGLPIAEADAFKAWGKTLTEGLDDCLKADFAFDWSKTEEDCVDGLHPTFSNYNFTNLDAWATGSKMEIQEVGPIIALRDTWKIEADATYWDETGKARFRQVDKYTNSKKCGEKCESFSAAPVLTLNLWYGVFASVMLGDGWTIAHALAAKPPAKDGSTLSTYFEAMEAVPMDPHSALPIPMRHFLRAYDITMYLFTPNSPKLGAVPIKDGEYMDVLMGLAVAGIGFLTEMAPVYGTPMAVTPILQLTNIDAILGWGGVPYWLDPISSAVFTYNFIGGATENKVTFGVVPSAFIEEKMSSSYYHEGLGYITQHYEAYTGSTTNNHSCGWDPDCSLPACFPTDTCTPLAAAGYDGGKVPGTYFGSAKGAPAFPAFKNFVATYYLVFEMTNTGRVASPVKVKGPDAEEDQWDFEGLYVMTTFKANSWTRRIENCNYPEGRVTESGAKDSPGIDCNWMKDTSPLAPYFGLPTFWHLMVRDVTPEGWDPAVANAEDGASVTLQDQLQFVGCAGNKFCTDADALSGSPAYKYVLQYGYEPNLGALVDVKLMVGLSWKLFVSPVFYPGITGNPAAPAFKLIPLFWVHNYLHLPATINMDLSKVQAGPATVNGLHILLLGQCMVSLMGGISCCFCGV